MDGYYDDRRYGYRRHGNGKAALYALGGVIVGAAITNAQRQQSTYPARSQPVYTPAPPRNIVWTGRQGTSSSGKYCREYYFTGTVGGREKHIYGAACRQPDSSWQLGN